MFKIEDHQEEPEKTGIILRQPVYSHALGLVKAGVKASMANLAQLLFPSICVGCNCLVSQTGTVCAQCWNSLRFIEKPYCPVMGLPFEYDLGKRFLCAEAIANPPPFRRLRSAVAHGGAAQRMSVLLKYYDRTDLAPWMARWMYRAGIELIGDVDIVVPIPLHPRRLWARRYNQSAELARYFARLTAKPYHPELIIRKRRTMQQTGLGTKERQRNVDGAFKVPDKYRILIQGRNILLIDDVYTTGATVKSATRTLMHCGAAHVDVLTFSRVLPENMVPASKF